MTTLAQSTPVTGPFGWFSRAEAWLDDKGKGAWIVVMVLGFIFIWPVGLALLAYMIWSKKMFSKSNGMSCNRHRRRSNVGRATGNAAFDAYKSETLQRLQEEQENFEAFLQRLRDARDKAEFDQFMDERAKSPATDDEDKKDA